MSRPLPPHLHTLPSAHANHPRLLRLPIVHKMASSSHPEPLASSSRLSPPLSLIFTERKTESQDEAARPPTPPSIFRPARGPPSPIHRVTLCPQVTTSFSLTRFSIHSQEPHGAFFFPGSGYNQRFRCQTRLGGPPADCPRVEHPSALQRPSLRLTRAPPHRSNAPTVDLSTPPVAHGASSLRPSSASTNKPGELLSSRRCLCFPLIFSLCTSSAAVTPPSPALATAHSRPTVTGHLELRRHHLPQPVPFLPPPAAADDPLAGNDCRSKPAAAPLSLPFCPLCAFISTLECASKIIDNQATSLFEQYKQEQEFADEPTPDDEFLYFRHRGVR